MSRGRGMAIDKGMGIDSCSRLVGLHTEFFFHQQHFWQLLLCLVANTMLLLLLQIIRTSFVILIK